MRAFLNIIAIAAIIAGAYGLGWLNYTQKWEDKKATVENPYDRGMKWENADWYRGADGNEYLNEDGKVYRANGCRNELGQTTKVQPIEPEEALDGGSK